MKLYVDDIRPAPEDWQQARTVTDAIRFLANFGEDVDEISLDHDISYSVEVAGNLRPFPSPEDFTAVAWYICARFVDKPIKVIVHSANPVGAREIVTILKSNLRQGQVEYVPATRVNRLESEV